jgi:D-alanyl-D-alanine carboxypeptidase/D-alanyl-D-alanine-endopeptidase (penicillin-binding protein 4)
VSRRLASVVAAVAVAAVALAATGTAVAQNRAPAASLASALAAPGLDPTRSAALAVDLDTGRVLYSQNPDRPLVPASNVKLVVAFAALRLLGPGYRLRTDVLGTGDGLREGTWRGDLVLRGAGDPTLAAADLDRLAADVRAWGIRRVRGAVVADEGRFDAVRGAPGWKPGFLGLESPPVGALVVDRADGWPQRPAALSAAEAFTAALRHHGVRVTLRPRTGVTPPDAFPLAQDLSTPLADVVRVMNRESDNFTAEMLLKELGAVFTGRGTTAAGARVATEALADAGVPLAGVRLVDGSGLSSHDRLTARALVVLLRAAERDGSVRAAFLASLAVAGVDGTLEDRLGRRPTFSRVIAKTGTTSLASSLSGFVRGRIVFAILHNGSPVPTRTARAAQDRFVTLLAAGR